jgi:hypothetical protein
LLSVYVFVQKRVDHLTKRDLAHGRALAQLHRCVITAQQLANEDISDHHGDRVNEPCALNDAIGQFNKRLRSQDKRTVRVSALICCIVFSWAQLTERALSQIERRQRTANNGLRMGELCRQAAGEAPAGQVLDARLPPWPALRVQEQGVSEAVQGLLCSAAQRGPQGLVDIGMPDPFDSDETDNELEAAAPVGAASYNSPMELRQSTRQRTR